MTLQETMSDFVKNLNQSLEEEKDWCDKQLNKLGNYENPPDGCPNCGRYRVTIGEDMKHYCEKCAWCIEDNATDYDLLKYLA